MTGYRGVRLLALLIVLLLALPGVALGQDATADPGPLPAAPGDGFAYVNVAVYVAFVVGGLLGALAGGGSMLAVISRIDKQTKDNAERLFLGLPPQWQATVNRVLDFSETAVKTADAALLLAREVTDGKPNREPEALRE